MSDTRSRRRIRDELMDRMRRQLTSRYDCCLWPATECSSTAIRAHSIQNSRVLDALCSDNHVVMPKVRVTPRTPPVIRFEKIGRNQATTFTGLCKVHDDELFAPIEKNAPNLQNAEHTFLIAYRAVLREAHATRKAAIDLQAGYLAGAEKGLWTRDEPSPAGLLAVEQMAASYFVYRVQCEFDRAYLEREWDRVRHEIFVLDVGATIAVNSMFSTGLPSHLEDAAAAFVCLNVFPHAGRTVAMFSFLQQDQDAAQAAFGRVWEARGHLQQYLLSKLLLEKCENLVIAPQLFSSFGAPQIEVIRHYFERNTFQQTFDSDDPRLFIFGRVD